MKRMISAMLVAGMLLWSAGCGGVSSDTMADIYYDAKQLGSYYSNYELSGSTQSIGEDTIFGTYKGLNGMVMLWNYEAPGDIALDIDYKFQVLHGKVKLVMVDPEGQIHTIEELSGGATSDGMKTESFSMYDGLYRLKLVGTDDAEVEFAVEIDEGDFIGAK